MAILFLFCEDGSENDNKDQKTEGHRKQNSRGN